MLSISDLQPRTLEDYEKSKNISRQIIGKLEHLPRSIKIEGNVNIAAEYPSSIIYIVDGMLKCSLNKKLVRFYSNNDFIITPEKGKHSDEIISSEFSISALIFTSTDFIGYLKQNDTLLDLWLEYNSLFHQIMLDLCSSFIGDDVRTTVDIRQYSKGDVIVKEGDTPHFLFEMIEGRATVFSENAEVGEIREGEIFGEISFLTESTRTATVVASQKCVTQAIHGEELEGLSRARPALIYAIAKTTAKRLLHANRRLKDIFVT